MHKCYLCGGEVGWLSDFTFGEVAKEGNGILHMYQCRCCGAEVEVYERVEEKPKQITEDDQITWEDYEKENQ